jgi:hypothetical protein
MMAPSPIHRPARRRSTSRTRLNVSEHNFIFALLSFILGSVNKPNDSLILELSLAGCKSVYIIVFNPQTRQDRRNTVMQLQLDSLQHCLHHTYLIYGSLAISCIVGHFQGNYFHWGRHDDSLIQCTASDPVASGIWMHASSFPDYAVHNNKQTILHCNYW